MLHSVDGVIDWYLISQVIRSSSDTVYLLAPVVVIFNKASGRTRYYSPAVDPGTFGRRALIDTDTLRRSPSEARIRAACCLDTDFTHDGATCLISYIDCSGHQQRGQSELLPGCA